MKGNRPVLDVLADEGLVQRFHNLLASVDNEELREVFHDFMVPANDSDQVLMLEHRLGPSIPRALATRTPPRGRGE
jgi:hypothetical protein